MKKMLAITAAAAAFAAAMPATAQTPEEFYKGKTVTLLIGFPPGGGYDANARTLARHIGKFIPGNPAVVPSNMPGAGSLVAANHTYNQAAADGTVFTIFASSAAMEAILGNKAARFDPTQFGWIGSMAQETAYCGVWQSPGAASSWKDVMEKETIFGGGAAAAITFQHPTILKNIFDAKIKVVSGYPGTRDVNLAMNRGEVNGSCGLFGSSINSQWLDEVKSGKLKLVLQMGPKKSAQFGGDIPSVFDIVKNEEDRQVLEVHFGQQLLSRPFATPPKVPQERLDALRDAFQKTMQDKDFLADAKKVGLDIDPVTGKEIEAALRRFASFPKAVLQRANEVKAK